MLKKWIIILVLILLACTLAFLIYNNYNKAPQITTVENTPTRDRGPNRATPPNVSPEKQAIIKAVITKMTAVMESKDAKKIREFTLSLYQDQSQRDAISQTKDAQILKSAEFYKELGLAGTISTALAYEPDSSWNISANTATVTQTTVDGRKTTFTATKVNGVWQ